jgi:hypothetical protein
VPAVYSFFKMWMDSLIQNCNLLEPFWKLFHLKYFVEFHCTIADYNLGPLVRVGPMLRDGGRATSHKSTAFYT